MVDLLSKDKLKAKFPWINTDGIELACHGIQNEGWFDPWALLFGLKRKAMCLGTEYVKAEVVGWEFQEDTDLLVVAGSEYGDRQYMLDKVIVKTPKRRIEIHSRCLFCISCWTRIRKNS